MTSSGPVPVGVDGEALMIDPPLEFRTLPAALRVRLPLDAPGAWANGRQPGAIRTR